METIPLFIPGIFSDYITVTIISLPSEDLVIHSDHTSE